MVEACEMNLCNMRAALRQHSLEVFLPLARLSMTTSNNLSGSECKYLKEHSKEGLV